jgi:hypothetical protein
MSDKAEFKIAYDGMALKDHAMNVRDLAPALLAFGNLFDEANRVINGSKTTVRLQVKATTPGSFDIAFILDQSFATQISGFLTGDFVTSALNLLEIMGLTYGGVKGAELTFFAMLRKLCGQKPTKVIDLKNGSIQIHIDHEIFVAPIELLRLYQDVGVRKATQDILEPLKLEGIDTFKVLAHDNSIIENIEKFEVDYFSLPKIEDELILETETEAAYSIISLAFKDENKWRLYDGSSTINVTMVDQEFCYQVDNSLISFTKGDILICKVKVIQYRTQNGLKTEYEVIKVKEHKSAARQLPLFDDFDD